MKITSSLGKTDSRTDGLLYFHRARLFPPNRVIENRECRSSELECFFSLPGLRSLELAIVKDTTTAPCSEDCQELRLPSDFPQTGTPRDHSRSRRPDGRTMNQLQERQNCPKHRMSLSSYSGVEKRSNGRGRQPKPSMRRKSDSEWQSMFAY